MMVDNDLKLVVLGVAVFTMAICGCQNPQIEAKETLSDNLIAMQAAKARSSELYEKAFNAYKSGDFDAARTRIEKSLDADGRNSHALMLLGVIEHESKNLFEAAFAFHRASRLEPYRYEPHYNTGIVLEEAGRYEQAIERYEAALALAPNELEVMENLVRCYVKSNTKLDSAGELIDKSLAQETRPEWRKWLEEMKTISSK